MELHNPGPEDLLCDESFLRYCRGEDPADTMQWETWLAAHPEQATVVNNARYLFDLLSVGQGNRLEQLTSLKDAIARRERFKEVIAAREAIPQITPAHTIRRNRSVIMGYAASVIALITVAALAYTTYTRGKAPRLYEYYTASDNHKTIMLPDSSVVILNGNSHLAISKNFDATHREVSVTGEAFFDIRHDANHPFIVHTNEYRIRVLGTSFNVRSYPDEKGTETDLITGKVEIVSDTEKERIVLNPEQKFILEKRTVPGKSAGAVVAPVKGTIARLKIDTLTHRAIETSWMRRKMEIKGETLIQIAERLQSWYGIQISFDSDAVKQYRYTATFDDENIFKVLQYLQQSYPFTYKIEHDSIVITQS